MIRLVTMCRLGNLYFQYAAARCLAERHKTGVEIDCFDSMRLKYAFKGFRSHPDQLDMLREFGVPLRFPVADFLKVKFGLQKAYPREGNLSYINPESTKDPTFYQLPDNVTIRGYFQSLYYFEPIQDLIREELRYAWPDDTATLAVRRKIRDCNAVAVNVRRGDLKHVKYSNLLEMDYYDAAIERMRASVEDPRFFVFSDNIEDCREMFKSHDVEYVDLPYSAQAPRNDMALMSECRHMILANGSFSWWASWFSELDDKIIICADRWLSDEQLNARYTDNTLDPSWIRIPARVRDDLSAYSGFNGGWADYTVLDAVKKRIKGA